MYVGITGTMGSGKGEVARILRQKGFKVYGFGDYIREELHKQGQEITIQNQAAFAAKMRHEHGPGYFSEQLLHKMQSDAPKHAVFETLRTLGELKVFRRLPGFLLISVDAPRELRWERIQSRGRHDNLHSFEEFCAYEDQHQLEGAAHEQHVLAVMDEADIKVVNIGNLDELREQLEEQLNI